MILDLLVILAFLTVPLLIEGGLIYGIFRTRKSIARKGIGCVSLLILPVVLCTTVLTIPATYNQIRLIRFGQQLYDYPLPPHTSEISRDGHITTWIQTSGSACVYSATRVIHTSLTEEQLDDYYNYALFDPVGERSLSAILEDRDGKLTPGVSFLEENVAIIAVADGMYGGWFIELDPRCWAL